MSTKVLEDFLDDKEYAVQVDRHRRTVHRWLSQPDGLPHIKLGNRTLIHVPTAREWMLSKMRRPNPRREP
jgi:hypothetical protein